MNKYFYILFFLFLQNATILSMALNINEETLSVYAIPGQNGTRSEPSYIKSIVGQDVRVISVATPKTLTDLGQYFCQRYLDSALKEQNQKGIIYATSQGTATALNYLAKKDHGKKIKALVLEAVLASGNSAIFHTVNGPLMNMHFVESLPGAYYWLAYLASLFLPGYRPAGQQPIKSITNIPKEIPIIIIHSVRDNQISYNDACALFYGLRMMGNANVYLITKNSHKHSQLIESEYEKNIIRQILIKHNLLKVSPIFEQQELMNLNQFQPDHEQFKQIYDDLIAKEKNHEIIEAASIASVAACSTYYYLQQ